MPLPPAQKTSLSEYTKNMAILAIFSWRPPVAGVEAAIQAASLETLHGHPAARRADARPQPVSWRPPVASVEAAIRAASGRALHRHAARRGAVARLAPPGRQKSPSRGLSPSGVLAVLISRGRNSNARRASADPGSSVSTRNMASCRAIRAGRARRTPKRASGASANHAPHRPNRCRRAAVRAERVR
jgi:hypothetical protein